MNVLDLALDDRTFDDLVELARSRLPATAPRWTDYNLHDPGITLIELMAWLAESQIYSLARLRRDERVAYARYAGVTLVGPRSARGLVWIDATDPANALDARVAPFSIVGTDANPIRPVDSDRPLLRAAWPTLLVPGRIVAVSTILASGDRVDRNAGNARGQVAYLPFGPDAGPRDRLRIDYACTAATGLGARAVDDADALLSIGVRADTPTLAGGSDDASHPVAIEATLLAGSASLPLPVVHDETRGFTRSGAIGLRIPRALPAALCAHDFAIEVRAPHGFACPPRVRQVGLNAIPVEQSVGIDHELHLATGQADQIVDLNALDDQVLRYDGGVPAPRVELASGATTQPWRAVARIDDAGPQDEVYVLDTTRGRLQFGNGVNGKVPPAGATIFVTYSVCQGNSGNQPRPRTWTASGVGLLGRNLDPITGGSDAQDLLQARGAARDAVATRRPLVTRDDIAAAALEIAGLRVARAQVLDVPGAEPATVTLVALREHDFPGAALDEPPRWLDAVRRALQPRMLLGQRLVVRAPDEIDVAVQATLEAAPMRDTTAIEATALAELARRLAPIATAPGEHPRELGVKLTAADIGAWLRKLDGVAAVRTLTLRDAAGRAVDEVQVGPFGLPRLDPASLTINVVRGKGRSRT